MKCAIMQPTFLPWAGYFNIIAEVDTFVFLDDAQLQKNSWHNRNQILLNHKKHWISVPVKRSNLGQTIAETKIDINQRWCSKLVKLLQQVYCKHPFAKDIMELCEILQQDDSVYLAELNIRLIKWFVLKMELPTKMILSSDLCAEGSRTERLVNLLQELRAECYLSPQGAKEYLKADDFTQKTSAVLEFQGFEPLIYNQHKSNDFESHLSIVDVLANLGWSATREYIIKGLIDE